MAENVTLLGAETITDLVETVDDTGIAMMHMALIGPNLMPALFEAADEGDVQAGRFVDVAGTLLEDIEKATTKAKAKYGCQLCRAPFWAKDTPGLVVVCTLDDNGQNATGFVGAVCDRCVAEHDEEASMRAALAASLEEQLGQRVAPMHVAGHA